MPRRTPLNVSSHDTGCGHGKPYLSIIHPPGIVVMLLAATTVHVLTNTDDILSVASSISLGSNQSGVVSSCFISDFCVAFVALPL